MCRSIRRTNWHCCLANEQRHCEKLTAKVSLVTWLVIGSEFNDFIRICLTKDPNQRPTAGQLLEHPFVRNALDPKPILDLLTEFKAEIVEEEITDMDDVSRILLELFLPFFCIILKCCRHKSLRRSAVTWYVHSTPEKYFQLTCVFPAYFCSCTFCNQVSLYCFMLQFISPIFLFRPCSSSPFWFVFMLIATFLIDLNIRNPKRNLVRIQKTR